MRQIVNKVIIDWLRSFYESDNEDDDENHGDDEKDDDDDWS